VGIGIFYLSCSCDLDLDPMTFIYELDPYLLEIYKMRKFTRCADMKFCIKAFEIYLQADTTEIIYHSPRRWSENSAG